MSADMSFDLPNVDAGLRVVKLKFWDKLVPIAFIVNSEPCVPVKVIGDMLNVDLEREMERHLRDSTYLGLKIDFITWNDPEVVELLGDSDMPWVSLSSLALWLPGLAQSTLKDKQALQTLHFLIMLLHEDPSKLVGTQTAGILEILTGDFA